MPGPDWSVFPLVEQVFKFSSHLGDVRPYCGLDVHKHELAACIFARDDAGQDLVASNVFGTDPAGLAAFWAFAREYRPVAFTMEATGVYHHVVATFLDWERWTAGWSFELLVINPADAKGIPGRQKNDPVDAEYLARYTAAELFKPGRAVATPLEEQRTRCKNRVKKTLDRAGFRPQRLELNSEWTRALVLALTEHRGTVGELLAAAGVPGHALAPHARYLASNRAYFAPYETVSLTHAQRALVRQELAALEFNTARKALLAVEVDAVVSTRPGLAQLVGCLASIPGLSPFSAAWLLAEVGPVTRFGTVGQFLAYCGLVPRTFKSAGRVYSGHLTRRSNKYARTVFYNAAVVLAYLVKKESRLKQYATRALKRKHHRTLGLLVVAAKIARVAYSVMRDRVPFNPDGGAQDPPAGVPGGFTVADRKTIRRARNCLQRLDAIEKLGPRLNLDVDRLARALDEALG